MKTNVNLIASAAFRSCRGYWSIAPLIAVLLFSQPAASKAGIWLGNNNSGPGGNDGIAQVNSQIDIYNLANATAFPYPTGLLDKTDNANFDPTDFMFFSDAAGTNMIGSPNNLSEAWFKYTGSAPLLYYSVKGPSSFGFSLFTYMAGLNHLDLVGDSREISHVSFWEGVPEPTGMTLAGGLLAAMALGRRRRMP